MAGVDGVEGASSWGRVAGGLRVPDLVRAGRVLSLVGLSFRRHGSRSPAGFSGDVGVLYSGEDSEATPVLRAALACPAIPSRVGREVGAGSGEAGSWETGAGEAGDVEGFSVGEYLDGYCREALEAAMEVAASETRYYAAGKGRDEAYRGCKGRGGRLGQHFGPSRMRRSPVLPLVVCDFDVPEEVVELLSSRGPDALGSEGSLAAVAVAYRGGLRYAGSPEALAAFSAGEGDSIGAYDGKAGNGGVGRVRARHTVLLSLATGRGAGDDRDGRYSVGYGLARPGREEEYEALKRHLGRPGSARVARALIAMRPSRSEPLTVDTLAKRLPSNLPEHPPEAYQRSRPNEAYRKNDAEQLLQAKDAYDTSNAYASQDTESTSRASENEALSGTNARKGKARVYPDVAEELSASVGVGAAGHRMVWALGAAGFIKRMQSSKHQPGGALWMTAKMRADTAAAIAEVMDLAKRPGAAAAPEAVVCVPGGSASRGEWLAEMRATGMACKGEDAGADAGVSGRGVPRLVFSGASAAAALLSRSPLEAPEPGEPLRLAGGMQYPDGEWSGAPAMPGAAAALGLQVLDAAEEEGLPEEAVLLAGYPDPGVLIDARCEETGEGGGARGGVGYAGDERSPRTAGLPLASPAQMFVDLHLYPGDCGPDYLQGLKSALSEEML